VSEILWEFIKLWAGKEKRKKAGEVVHGSLFNGRLSLAVLAFLDVQENEFVPSLTNDN